MRNTDLPSDADLPETSLDELPPRLRDACARAGWTELMPVQRRAIPYLVARRDAMIQSRTGSGKTGAFLLPILERIDTRANNTQALVLVPTRELAKQVEREAALLAGDAGVRTVAVYGGTSYGPQMDAFSRGVHLVVGTPGRVLDHLLRRTLTLDEIDILVLDEADRMLSMGFYPDMQKVKSYLRGRAVNTYLFSATFPPYVLGLARDFLHEPETLSLSTDHVHVTDVLHVYYSTEAADKDRALTRILEIENPTAAIVFSNTKRMVHYITVILQRFGWDADELSADLSQRDRERVMQRVRDGELRVLVATDVAARGIDIPELSHVFQYEPPEDPEAYIHRAGRTGRAGASGRAITLASGNTIERMALDRIGKQFEIDLQERPVPTEEDAARLVSQRITARLEAEYRNLGDHDRERLESFVPLACRIAADEETSVLLAMVLDDWYQRAVHDVPPHGRGPVAPLSEDDAIARLGAELGKHGQLERERLERFVPLAQQLAEIEDESVLLALALDDWHARARARSQPRSRARGSERKRRPPRQDSGGRPQTDAAPSDRPSDRPSDAPGDAPRRRRRRGRRGGRGGRGGGGGSAT